MATTESSRKYLNKERATELLGSWRSSGQSLKAFAEFRGVSEVTLTRWLRRLNATAGTRAVTPAFVQVDRMPVGEITVHAHGVSIQVPAALLEESLPCILRALRC
jgi:hypothetical protein